MSRTDLHARIPTIARLSLAALAWTASPFVATAQTPTQIFVDASITGTQDGTGWSTAFSSLQDGLDAAMLVGGERRILVAEGTYEPTAFFPTTSANPKHRTFLLDGESLSQSETFGIHGGFVGYNGGSPGSDQYDSPDGSFEDTVLSGNGKYHVITVRYVTGGAHVEIDGFKVTGGYANGTAGSGDDVGGGVRITRDDVNDVFGTVTIENSTFNRNYARTAGGALYLEIDTGGSSSGSLRVNNSLFFNNSALEGGAFYAGPRSVSVFGNVTFRGNGRNWVPADVGGAMSVRQEALIRAMNCVFYDNLADTDGSAAYVGVDCIDGGNPQKDDKIFKNCTIAFNEVDGAESTGAAVRLYCVGGTNVDPFTELLFNNTILWQNTNSFGVLDAEVDTALTSFVDGSYSDYTSTSSILNFPTTIPSRFEQVLFVNPKFVAPNPVMEVRNLRLRNLAPFGGSVSPLIDHGDDARIDTDAADVDDDDAYGEVLPLDLDLAPRNVNFNGVSGPGGSVDMGAYEAPNVISQG